MTGRVGFTEEALLFLRRERRLSEADAVELVRKAVKLFEGDRINIDVKKLKGGWMGFHRIRKGRIRVIAAFDFEHHFVLVERVDWRGGVYR